LKIEKTPIRSWTGKEWKKILKKNEKFYLKIDCKIMKRMKAEKISLNREEKNSRNEKNSR
jgi:hypothetical protein